MTKIETHAGSIHEKTNTPKRVPKLIAPGIISKTRYNALWFFSLMSLDFEISK